MKKQSIIKTQVLYLAIIGLLIMAFSQILVHYTNLSDSLYGAIIGSGIGLLIFAITKLARLRQQKLN